MMTIENQIKKIVLDSPGVERETILDKLVNVPIRVDGSWELDKLIESGTIMVLTIESPIVYMDKIERPVRHFHFPGGSRIHSFGRS